MGNNGNPPGFTARNLREEKNLWERKGYNLARSRHTPPNESLDAQFKQNALREKEELEAIVHRFTEEKKELQNHLIEMDKRSYALRIREEKRKDTFSKLTFSLLDRKNRRNELEKELVATYEELGQKRINRLHEHSPHLGGTGTQHMIQPTSNEERKPRKSGINFSFRRNPLKKIQLKLYKTLIQQEQTYIKNPAPSPRETGKEYLLITHVDAHLFPNLVRSIESLEKHLLDNRLAIEDLEARIKEMEQKKDSEYIQVQEERRSLLADQKDCFRRLEELPHRLLDAQQFVGVMWQKRKQWILKGAQVGSLFNDGNPN